MVFKSFLVTNKLPGPRAETLKDPQQREAIPEKPVGSWNVSEIEWFKLRKFEFNRDIQIDDVRLQKKLREYMDKHNNWVQLDIEKAMLLA